MKIIFESQDFVVLDKPGGWLTIPSRMGVIDPRPCLGIELARLKKMQIWPIHRLDFEVTGLVLFAKNPEAHKRANGWFEERRVHKYYEALSEGQPPDDSEVGWTFHWRSTLMKGKKRCFRSAHGKPAETIARWKGHHQVKDKKYLLWELEPLTGRSHQLRFEMADHNCPILGDQLYGSTNPFLENTIALRAVRLDLSQCALKDLDIPSLIEAESLLKLC